MINPDYIKLYCNGCKKYILIKRNDIDITLDLSDNIYIFKACCDKCETSIKSIRDYM